MSWAKLDDQFFDHPKARQVGLHGRALFVAGLCWSAGNLTDGFIADTDLQLVAAKAEVPGAVTARRLVDAGLWAVVAGGWVVHDYHDFNPSSESERKRRAARVAAGRAGGRSSKPGSKPEAKPEAKRKQTASKNGSETEANENPVPVPVPVLFTSAFQSDSRGCPQGVAA
jgi:hypothetical protein